MSNIFKNAYFGKAYKTRDNKKVLYQRNFLSTYIEPSDGSKHYISLHTVMTDQHIWQVDDEGKREDLRRMSGNFDIVSEWDEEPFGDTSNSKLKFGDAKLLIDEEELDKLAEEYENETYGYSVNLKDDIETDCSNQQNIIDIHDAFKSGYRKAKNK